MAFGYNELARVALSFVLEDESWPVFDQYARMQPHSAELHAWLDDEGLAGSRRAWMLNSPDEAIREAAS